MSELSDRRLAICNSCPYNAEGVCILCGCDLAIKTKNPTESCPHTPQKWGAEQNIKPERVSVSPSFAEGGTTAPTSNGACIPCSQKTR